METWPPDQGDSSPKEANVALGGDAMRTKGDGFLIRILCVRRGRGMAPSGSHDHHRRKDKESSPDSQPRPGSCCSRRPPVPTSVAPAHPSFSLTTTISCPFLYIPLLYYPSLSLPKWLPLLFNSPPASVLRPSPSRSSQTSSALPSTSALSNPLFHLPLLPPRAICQPPCKAPP